MATNNFIRKFSTNIGTTATAVGGYQVLLDVQTTAIGLSLANVSASQVTATVTLNTQAGDTVHIIKDAPIPSGGALIPIGGDMKVVMEHNDQIKVTSDTASSIDAILDILEIDSST